MADALLHRALLAKENELIAKLAGSRELIDHPGEKGDATELEWRPTIGDFLPARYQVTKASVIDADGAKSHVIDAVIHDRHYCPLFFEYGGARYIPAESVYAVFEIKQKLNKENVEYAVEKSESVRRLRRTSTTIVERGVTKEPREDFTILAGLLTFESDWTPALGDSLTQTLGAAPEAGRLDLGCALRKGAFEVNYSDEAGVTMTTSGREGALLFLLLRLFARLQELGTVNAIDLDEYGRSLEGPSD